MKKNIENNNKKVYHLINRKKTRFISIDLIFAWEFFVLKLEKTYIRHVYYILWF